MTLRTLPSAEVYVTREELARELKVSTRTIDRWRTQGMPSELWGPRSGTRRFPRAAAVAWARSRGGP